LPSALTAQDANPDRVRRILAEVPLIDGHNDLPGAIREAASTDADVASYDLRARTPGDTDLERLRAGMVGAQFWYPLRQRTLALAGSE
jgi:membrane dipeptidase